MINITYDPIRDVEMDQFLKRMYDISIQNNIYLTDNMIYYQLMEYGLKQSDYSAPGELLDVSDMFEKWQAEYSYVPEMDVFVDENWKAFCQFVSNKHLENRDNFIKLYIPLDSRHLYKGAELLFNYITEQDIVHESKIARNLRSDNVVVRLGPNDYESAPKIINYVNENQYLKEGLSKTNPFVPTINGVGYMEETGISYNCEIATLMSAYIHEAVINNNNVSIDEFVNWVMLYADNYLSSEDKATEVKDILLKSIDKNYHIENVTNNNSQDINNNEPLLSKDELLSEAVFATYAKFGYNQAMGALSSAIAEGDYRYFTNGSVDGIQFRDELKAQLGIQDVRERVFSTVLEENNNSVSSIEEALALYLNKVLDDKVLEFDKICSVTLEKYNDGQLIDALINFYENNNCSGFSKYDVNSDDNINYRQKISNYTKEEVLEVAKLSLQRKGINAFTFSEREVFTTYAYSLQSYMNKNVEVSQAVTY